MQYNIVETLMQRDNMTREEAEDLKAQAREDLLQRLNEGNYPFDICQEWFGLEPDYIDDLLGEYSLLHMNDTPTAERRC